MRLRQTDLYRYKSGQPHLFWRCQVWPICESTVGADPKGNPQGTPADAETKQLRGRCHEMFDIWWQSGTMTRKQAYKTLQRLMNMTKEDAHFGRFTAAQCREFLDKVKQMNLQAAYVEVAGHLHYLEAAEKVTVGQSLKLRKEPENKFDAKAIAVMNADERIGYIPRNKTAAFHPLMDANAIQSVEILNIKEPRAEHHTSIMLKVSYDQDELERFLASRK